MNARKKLIVGGLVAGGLMVGVSGLVLCVGIARADEGGYLTALRSDGVIAPSPSRQIVVGEAVCVALREGNTQNAVLDVLIGKGMDPAIAVDVVFAAQEYLCPDIASAPSVPRQPGQTVANWSRP